MNSERKTKQIHTSITPTVIPTVAFCNSFNSDDIFLGYRLYYNFCYKNFGSSNENDVLIISLATSFVCLSTKASTETYTCSRIANALSDDNNNTVPPTTQSVSVLCVPVRVLYLVFKQRTDGRCG
jgi:hypothetical protein